MNFKTSTALIGALLLPAAVMAQNIAVVNGKGVPKSRVDTLIRTATHGHPEQAPPEMQAQAKDQVVMREIFAQEAEREGVMNSPEYKAQLELVRQTVLINTMFENYEKAHPVTDAEALAQYNKIKAAQSGD